MTVKASTGLRDKLLVTGSLKGVLETGDNMKLRIYTGAVPAKASDALAAGNTLLVELSDDATAAGLIFDTVPSNGVLSKDAAQIWRGVNVASGTATFFRLVADGDDGSLSTTQPRIQGTVGVAGEDLNLSDVELVVDADQKLTYFVVNLPTL